MMRSLVCILFAAAAWQLHAQGEVFAPKGSYAGEIPHRAAAPVIFYASIGDFTTGPLKMRLIGRDVATQEEIITFLMPATRRGNIIRASFPFGGRYVGRYDPGRDLIVGRLIGFAPRGRPHIPREPFAMTPANTNAAAVASPPAN